MTVERAARGPVAKGAYLLGRFARERDRLDLPGIIYRGHHTPGVDELWHREGHACARYRLRLRRRHVAGGRARGSFGLGPRNRYRRRLRWLCQGESGASGGYECRLRRRRSGIICAARVLRCPRCPLLADAPAVSRRYPGAGRKVRSTGWYRHGAGVAHGRIAGYSAFFASVGGILGFGSGISALHQEAA